MNDEEITNVEFEKETNSDKKPEIVVEDVIDLLKKGYTRYEKDNQERAKAGQTAYGSIENKYGLTKSAVKLLFEDDRLKGKRSIFPKENPFTLVSREELTEALNSDPLAEMELSEMPDSTERT